MDRLTVNISILLLIYLAFYPGYSIPKEGSRDLTRFYRVIGIHPHDSNAQTEGLQFVDGFLYEGTGPCLNAPSGLRKIKPFNGDVTMIRELPLYFFCKGITIFKENLIQLTYKTHIGFVYDKKTFELHGEFYYPTEGWGLTNDGTYLIMSDGTATLHYLDPETFQDVKQIQVRNNNGPVIKLNELEYINGEIYANVFETPHIVCIHPETGWVIGAIDLSVLFEGRFPANDPIDLANGIAYDPDTGRLFITGKYWSKLYELEITDKKYRRHLRRFSPSKAKPQNIEATPFH